MSTHSNPVQDRFMLNEALSLSSRRKLGGEIEMSGSPAMENSEASIGFGAPTMGRTPPLRRTFIHGTAGSGRAPCLPHCSSPRYSTRRIPKSQKRRFTRQSPNLLRVLPQLQERRQRTHKILVTGAFLFRPSVS